MFENLFGTAGEKQQEKTRAEKEKAEYKAKLKKTRELAPKYLLTSSAEAYVASTGKYLSDFDLFSVDGQHLGFNNLEKTILACKYQMIEKAQKLGAEVVVDVKPAIGYHQMHYQPAYMIGTALVPKKNK